MRRGNTQRGRTYGRSRIVREDSQEDECRSASSVKITRADGTTEERPAYTLDEVMAIVHDPHRWRRGPKRPGKDKR